MEEEKKYIKLEKPTDVLRLWIQDANGKETGEYIDINTNEIDLLDRVQKMQDNLKKNETWYNNQLVIIKKQQDHISKGNVLSDNTIAEMNAIKEYYKKQKQVFDVFLGEGATDKLLYGRPFGAKTAREIYLIIQNQILPQIKVDFNNLEEEIKDTFKKPTEENVLTDE